jgi:hypothetical protein
MIIGLVLILVSLLWFNFEHISRGRSDWTVIVIGLVLGGFGMWMEVQVQEKQRWRIQCVSDPETRQMAERHKDNPIHGFAPQRTLGVMARGLSRARSPL